ncbi:MAG: hypothetical protein R3A48_19280 [Polyangiales bacterium]
MDSIPPPDPGLALEALSSRVEREIARLDGARATQTELIGGWAKIGSGLDHVLRAVFVQQCGALGLAPGATFARVTREAWDLERASAGQLLHAVSAMSASARGRDAGLDRATAHLAHPTIARTIELRNVLIHARREPTREELSAVLRALRVWIAAARGG